MPSRQLHLNVNLLHSGVYASAWRLPESDPRACFDVGHYVRVARIAERGKLDAIFLADTPAVTDRIDYRPFLSMEPTIVLATVAASTSYIGLIATASTTYNEPYNIARRFATLDLASGGRAGWNAVTTADAAASRNFGLPGVLEHKARYERAKEFAEVVHALWDSWEDDAFIGDKAVDRMMAAILPRHRRKRFSRWHRRTRKVQPMRATCELRRFDRDPGSHSVEPHPKERPR
jgi:alkanesulfonate monooxygenase SsuD/methylene tetrahydromethanopterin reductase-like flavin-dependent oxidoreductase (luciferase family)